MPLKSVLPVLALAPLLLGAAAPGPRDGNFAGLGGDGGATSGMAETASLPREQRWHQVRILQQFSIRITPGAPMPPQMRFELDREEGSRFEERSIGKCLASAQIAAVQSVKGNRLLLFMRDQRIVSASLEKACRASEFYSGFYMQRSADGQLCVDRDVLQARSGASCKVRRWRELVEVPDRHFP